MSRITEEVVLDRCDIVECFLYEVVLSEKDAYGLIHFEIECKFGDDCPHKVEVDANQPVK